MTTEEEPIHMFYLFEHLPDILTKEYLEKVITVFKEDAERDYSNAYDLEELIVKRFIENVIDKKYTESDVSIIGAMILDIKRIPFRRSMF